MAWIDLAQFASKYGISQSTLRRRIRANTITFRLERGKYFLEDSPTVLSEAPLFARNVNQPLTTAASQRAIQSHAAGESAGNSPPSALEDENRKLKKQLAELETFVSALEAEIRRLQATQSPSPARNEFGITENF